MIKRLPFRQIVVFCGIFFAAAQFVRPSLPETPRAALLQGAVVPPDVEAILERACKDCHSNNTEWPWYSHIYPMSQLVATDVEHGRAFVNLSNWQSYSKGKRMGYLTSLSLAVLDQSMPPRKYTALHAGARLTPQERQMVATWAKQEQFRLRSHRTGPETAVAKLQ